MPDVLRVTTLHEWVGGSGGARLDVVHTYNWPAVHEPTL